MIKENGMKQSTFVQIVKDNEEHYELFRDLMIPYNEEFAKHEPNYPINSENVLEATRGMINMQGPHDRHLELVYDGNSLIGFHYCKVDHIGHKGFIKPEYGYIMEFYVKPEFRRQGYGRMIFNREEALFASHGVKRMYLNADPVTGLPFWIAVGFVGSGEIQPHNNMEIYEKEVQG
jgi:GNAT superfamily N-acetyltransferase